MLRLTRRQDAIVDRFRRAARRAPSEPCVLLDGEHLIRDAVDAGVPVDVVIATQERWTELRDLWDALEHQPNTPQLYDAPATVLEAASPVKTPSGIVALARWQAASIDEALDGPAPLVLAAVDVQDPGNFGAIIRSADALGATGVVAAGASADPAGWKALRGAMGSAFRIPVAKAPVDAALAAAKSAGLRIYAASMDGAPLNECNLTGPTLLLLGSEGLGLPPAALGAADDRIAIPMRAGVNSLNVAVTAALLLYEARRQRA
ncbi:MAG: RNA methyltransferase [Acidobacteria bacterium]|nr:MAG: RNA methyltransferase [Acidobacteriota bacterium]